MKNLLLVEEDREGREALAKVLKRRGFRVVEAADEASALEMVRSELPLDVVIAGATEQDRSAFLVDVHDQRPSLPVVFLTDYCWPEARLRSLLFGAFALSRRLNFYLNMRPIGFAELERLILAILYGQNAGVMGRRVAA
jgi:DNA-binding NtrC family response regulator